MSVRAIRRTYYWRRRRRRVVVFRIRHASTTTHSTRTRSRHGTSWINCTFPKHTTRSVVPASLRAQEYTQFYSNTRNRTHIQTRKHIRTCTQMRIHAMRACGSSRGGTYVIVCVRYLWSRTRCWTRRDMRRWLRLRCRVANPITIRWAAGHTKQTHTHTRRRRRRRGCKLRDAAATRRRRRRTNSKQSTHRTPPMQNAYILCRAALLRFSVVPCDLYKLNARVQASTRPHKSPNRK